MKINIKILYLYLFSFVGLLITVIGSIQLVDLGIKTLVFKDADIYINTYEPVLYGKDGSVNVSTEEAKLIKKERDTAEKTNNERNKQRQVATSLSMILVGAPLYFYHWKKIQKEDQ